MDSETKNILEKAITNLPEKYREVYVFREIEGVSVQECAKILSLSEVNVKVRLLKAKNLLKKELIKSFDKNEILVFGNERCDTIVENVMGCCKI